MASPGGFTVSEPEPVPVAVAEHRLDRCLVNLIPNSRPTLFLTTPRRLCRDRDRGRVRGRAVSVTRPDSWVGVRVEAEG